jgi:hypothetical protein
MSHINPYEILGVSETATNEDIKALAKELILKHHPDKGGNGDATTWNLIKSAIAMIKHSRKTGVSIASTQPARDFHELKSTAGFGSDTPKISPQELMGISAGSANRNFDSKTFNDKFKQFVNAQNDYVISGGDSATLDADRRETRTREQLLSEHSAIDSELGQIKPMFNGHWDANAFNRMYEHHNENSAESKALRTYVEPESLSSALQPYTEIGQDFRVNGQIQILSQNPFGITGSGGTLNPNQIDTTMLSHFANQPDITKIAPLDAREAQKRVSEYQQISISIPQGGAPPPASINGNSEHISKTQFNQDMNSLLAKRGQAHTSNHNHNHNQPVSSPIFQTHLGVGNGTHQPVPIMDYPQNSKFAPTPQQIPQQQPHYQPPIQFNSFQTPTPTFMFPSQNSNTTSYSNSRNQNNFIQNQPQQQFQYQQFQNQLQAMQNKVAQQEQIIKKLSRRKKI